MLNRWRRLSRAWRFILIAGAAFGTLMAIITYPAYQIVSRDPRLCFQCHLMRDAIAAWEKSAHKEITCVECHHGSMLGDVKRLLITVFAPRAEVGAHAEVKRETCAKCHAGGGDPNWPVIAATAGHAVHLEDGKVECVDCHSPGVHEFHPPEELCLKCHVDVTVNEGEMAEVHCLSCHSYLAPTTTLKSRASDCLACHGSAGGHATSAARPLRPDVPAGVPTADVVHGGVACAQCHNPHAWDDFERRIGRDCALCHTDQWRATVAADIPGHGDCRTCHEPHAPRAAIARACSSCHALSGGAAEAGKGAAPDAGAGKGAAPAAAAGAGKGAAPDAAAPRFSFEDAPHKGDCKTCHVPHSWDASPDGCAECHDDVAKRAEARAPDMHGGCATCHDPHLPTPGAAACARCHKAEAKVIAASYAARRAPEHARCSSCHAPHAETDDPLVSCGGCHADKAAALAAGPKEHRTCDGCHTPHDTARPGAASSSCVKCHAPQRGLVARAGTPEAHAECTSCHAVHPGAGRAKPGAPTAACATCHEAAVVAASSAIGTHRGTCVNCHVNHGPPATKKPCAGCHEEVHARPPAGKGAAAHGDCRSCHAPHESSVVSAGACVRCHAKEAAAGRDWLGDTHSGCPGCHDPHAVASRTKCESCHAGPAVGMHYTAAPHRDCAKCHAPHQPPPVGRVPGWWRECGDCHAAEVKAVAARGAIHAACKNCHPEHTFSVKACAGCHPTAKLAGLHGDAGHSGAKCSVCHDAHVAPVAGKAPCLACHVDQKGHEPGAARCAACHPFVAAPKKAAATGM